MTDRLQWTLQLIDKMTGPGKSAAAAFERLTDSQVEAISAAQRLVDVEERAAAALREVQDGTRKLTGEDLDLVAAARSARNEFEALDKASRLAGVSNRGPSELADAYAKLSDDQLEVAVSARRMREAEDAAGRALREVEGGIRDLTARDLELVAGARQARHQLEALEEAAKLKAVGSGPSKLASSFAGLSNRQIEVMASARRMADAEEKANRALREVEAGVRKLTSEDVELVASARHAATEFKNLKSATHGLDALKQGMTGSLLEAALWENLARGILNAARAVVQWGAQAAVAIGTKFFDMAQWAQDTRSSLAVFAGSAAAGNKEFDQIADTANKMGLAVQATTDAYKGLRAARFGSREAEDMIKLGADLQTVVGVSDDAIQRYLLAITQMKAKGKTSAEELLQIQEAVNLSQGAIFESLSQQLGKSLPEIAKMQETGKITADQGIAAIKAATLQMVHASAAGEATSREVSTTLRGMVRLAKSGADTWFISIGERLMPAFDSLAKRVVKTFQDFDKSGKFGAFTDAVVVTFERLVSAIEDAWPRIEGLFGDGIDGMTEGLLDLSRSFDDLLDTILNVAEFVRDHWTGVKYTFVTVSAVIASAITAIGASSVIDAVKNITKTVKSLSGAYRDAAAAQKALAAAESISGAGGTVATAGKTAAAGTVAKTAGLSLGAAVGTIGAATVINAASNFETTKKSREQKKGAASDITIGSGVASVAGMGIPDFSAFSRSSADSLKIANDTTVQAAKEAGAATTQAYADGIGSAEPSVWARIAGIGQSAIQGLKDAIGWHSPPAAFVELGQGSGAAFMAGLNASLPSVVSLNLDSNIGPANDVMAQFPAIPMAVGAGLTTPTPQAEAPPPSATAGLTVQPGASYGGSGAAQQIWQVSINVTVEGNASADDAAELAESIQASVMPKVRAEIQRTLSNAGGSAT